MTPDRIDMWYQIGIVGVVFYLFVKETFSFLKFKRQDAHEAEVIKNALAEVLAHLVIPILNKQTEILQELVITERVKGNHGAGG